MPKSKQKPKSGAKSAYTVKPVHFGPHDKDLLDNWLPNQGPFSAYVKRLIYEDQRRGGSKPADPLQEQVARLVAEQLRLQGGIVPRAPIQPFAPKEAKSEEEKAKVGDKPTSAMTAGLF